MCTHTECSRIKDVLLNACSNDLGESQERKKKFQECDKKKKKKLEQEIHCKPNNMNDMSIRELYLFVNTLNYIFKHFFVVSCGIYLAVVTSCAPHGH